jgi:small subunit ribosomal protein S1
VSQGDDTPVKIIEVDADRRRLSLSIKRVEPEDEILASIELEGLPPRREPVATSDDDDDPRYSAEANDIAALESSLAPAIVEDGLAEPEPEGVEESDPTAETSEEVEAEAIAVEEPEVEPETSHEGEPAEAVAEPETAVDDEAPVAAEPEAETGDEAEAETEEEAEAEAEEEAEAEALADLEPVVEETAPEVVVEDEQKPEPELGLSDDVFGDAADGEVEPADAPA